VNSTTLLYPAIALVIGYALGQYHARAQRREIQTTGEAEFSRVISSSFVPPDYHLMNHLTLRLEDGTTQIDHVLVSRFGVFVIESKHFSGWILGNEKHAQWTQVLFNSKFKFQNPIHQNYRHVMAVRGLLDFLPPEAVRSAVVFTGGAEFKTEVPDGVFSLPEFVTHLREQTSEVMSLNRMQFCVGRLETARLAVSGETDVEHVRNLRRRYGGTE
jgi:Nuclease-related domain